MTEPLEPLHISVKQAAEVLGISVVPMYALLDAQQVESRYFGRRRLVVYKSLKNYAAALPTYPTSRVS